MNDFRKATEDASSLSISGVTRLFPRCGNTLERPPLAATTRGQSPSAVRRYRLTDLGWVAKKSRGDCPVSATKTRWN
jgi:hypothetical protein